MLKQKRILQSDIRLACGDTYYSRGKGYYDEGRVFELTIIEDKTFHTLFKTAVEGSGTRYYEQFIRLEWRKDYSSVSIDGECSCPMEFNCKHIAAACLEFMEFDAQGMQSSVAVPSCFDWLDNFDTAEVERDSSQEFITYILNPGKTDYSFSLDYFITKKNKKRRV